MSPKQPLEQLETQGPQVARRCGRSQSVVFLCRLYENKGEADFMESLLQLFRSISTMMSSMSDQTFRVKVGPRLPPQPRSRPAVSCRLPCLRLGQACCSSFRA